MHFHSLLSLHFFVITYKLLTICMYVNESKTKNKSTEIKATGKREQLCRFRCLFFGDATEQENLHKKGHHQVKPETHTLLIFASFFIFPNLLSCALHSCAEFPVLALFFPLCLSVMSNLWYN